MHNGVDKRMKEHAHPASCLVEQRHSAPIPLGLPIVSMEGQRLCCDKVHLELRGLDFLIIDELIMRRGRLLHVRLLQLIAQERERRGQRSLRQVVLARHAYTVIRKLRELCAERFAATHPQIHWLPNKGRSDAWLLLRLKEKHVLAHMDASRRVADLFHRHQFHYDPVNQTS